jgi:hypothetical protein
MELIDWHRKNHPYLYHIEKWFVFLVTLSELDIVTALERDNTYFKISDELESK